ncbi:MAG: hypothetical protein K1X29_06095 [Bdellovibrionales bacterium]|nr:hypothetical protein [Bdellovibrionales bacterium]
MKSLIVAIAMLSSSFALADDHAPAPAPTEPTAAAPAEPAGKPVAKAQEAPKAGKKGHHKKAKPEGANH